MEAMVNGARLAYRAAGRPGRPALVLAHGFPLDSGMWEAQLSGLADRCFVVAPDLRGHGQSDVPAGSYSMEQHADDLAGLMDALRIEKAVAGLSMGGYVALAFWKRHTARVQRPGADRHPRKRGHVRRQVDAECDDRPGRQHGVAILADEMMPRLLAPENLGDTRWLSHCETSSSDSPWKEWPWRSPPCATGRTATGVLPTITAPALVMVGEADAVTPLAVAEAMAAAIPDVKLVVVADAGHMAPMEAPEDVNKALLDLCRSRRLTQRQLLAPHPNDETVCLIIAVRQEEGGASGGQRGDHGRITGRSGAMSATGSRARGCHSSAPSRRLTARASSAQATKTKKSMPKSGSPPSTCTTATSRGSRGVQPGLLAHLAQRGRRRVFAALHVAAEPVIPVSPDALMRRALQQQHVVPVPHEAQGARRDLVALAARRNP